MKTVSARLFRLSGYTLYAVALLLLLAVLRFPGEELRRYGEGRLAALVPGSSWRILGLSYRFPLTVSATGLELTLGEGREVRLLAEHLRASLVSLAYPGEVAVSAALYGGAVQGRLRFVTGAGLAGGDLRLEGVDVARLPAEFFPGGRRLSGRLDARGELSFGPATSPSESGLSGRGEISLRDGSISLFSPLLSLHTLDVGQLSCGLRLDRGRLDIVSGQLRGAELKADFSGWWQSGGDIFSGQVQLGGQVQPADKLLAKMAAEERHGLELLLADHEGGLPFTVTGSVGSPLFRFDL